MQETTRPGKSWEQPRMQLKVAIEVGGLTVRAVRAGSLSSRIFATTKTTTTTKTKKKNNVLLSNTNYK